MGPIAFDTVSIDESPTSAPVEAPVPTEAPAASGCPVPHGPIKDAPYGSGLSFRDPDNIALELFAPPA